ncbi:uncharacterized protein EDB93DRAFT_725170 [Suillus bovinus]|uniref:uncharacterized protein n=1 Tax=Suillus bovinus TaxID=48563 RepID=UPI001B8632DC|nr:uncharacterized protein EDB93DRAFT_725170 [Suillus bovinus]KAG2138445.1 hypothetical protein EDB93DRAFT_725170 [Suillus bovinus]
MVAPRFTGILALLTFLAGANAECATCNHTLEVGTTSYRLVNTTLESASGYICTYEDSAGDMATCEYYVSGGYVMVGDELCPHVSSLCEVLSGGQ